MKFLHLSDFHIHTNEVDNKNIAANLKNISTKYQNHYLIVTGDITDDGATEQYQNAYNLLQPFTGRISIVPGNHDFGAAGNFYSEERARRFDEMLAKPLNQGGTFKGDNNPVVNMHSEGSLKIMLIALDSNLETDHPFDFACGEIGEAQLRALKTILSTTSTADIVKILIFHHHPFMVNDPFMELKDARQLASAVFNRIDLILFGHKHQMNQWEKRWGSKHMLASDNTPGKKFAKEITIDQTGISVQPVQI